MSRVINVSSPGKRRHHSRRTIAELLRHLGQKTELDAEAKDMAAAVVINLQEIADTIEVTTEAWEKRDYYLKADRFRLEWEWVQPAADALLDIVVGERWELLAIQLASLSYRFNDVKVARMTRPASTWEDSCEALVAANQ